MWSSTTDRKASVAEAPCERLWLRPSISSCRLPLSSDTRQLPVCHQNKSMCDWGQEQEILSAKHMKQMSIVAGTMMLVSTLLVAAAEADSPRSDIARTPPMGWNSYDAFGSSVTEAEILTNALYMKECLLAHGWNY